MALVLGARVGEVFDIGETWIASQIGLSRKVGPRSNAILNYRQLGHATAGAGRTHSTFPLAGNSRATSVRIGRQVPIDLDRAQLYVALLDRNGFEEGHGVAAREAVIDSLVETLLDLAQQALGRTRSALHRCAPAPLIVTRTSRSARPRRRLSLTSVPMGVSPMRFLR